MFNYPDYGNVKEENEFLFPLGMSNAIKLKSEKRNQIGNLIILAFIINFII